MQEEVLRIVNTGNQEMKFTIVNHLPEFIFITETEFEAVAKACEWILKGKR